MHFVILVVVLWTCYFGEAHLLDVGDKGVSQFPLVTPFIAITVLILVTQVKF